MDQETRNRLIEAHMSRAQVIAVQIWRRTPSNVELDELRAIAYTGLCQAANAWEGYCDRHNYDPARIEFFTPYVVRRMHGAILDELRKTDWLSKTQRAAVKKIQQATGDADGLSTRELGELTGMSEQEVRRSLAGAVIKRPVSLDSGDGIDIAVTDSPASRLQSLLVHVVAALEPSERAVLALHYFAGMEFRDIAVRFEVPLADVKSWHTEAIATVYAALAAVVLGFPVLGTPGQA